MRRHFTSSAIAVVLAVSGGLPASADVTAKEVWEMWRTLAEASGQTVTAGAIEQRGDALVVSDLTLAGKTPEMTLEGRLAEVVLQERGDGTVLVTMSPRYELRMAGLGPEAAGRMLLAVTQDGLAIVASDEGDSIALSYRASAIRAKTEEFVVEGKPVDFDLAVSIPDVKGKYTVGRGEGAPLAGSLRAGGLEMKLLASNGETQGKFTAALSLEGLETQFAGTPVPVDPANMAAALRAGLRMETSFSHGPASYLLDFAEKGDAFSLRATESTGSVAFSLSKEAMSYDLASEELSMRISASQLPLPEIAFMLGEFQTALTMPVSASETPQDLAVKLRLVGLAPSDMIWGMLDPAGSLPHEPATLVVDISGKANWAFDIMDPQAAQAAKGAVPGELHELTLHQLRLAAAGAELSGSGGFTFDNSDLTSFDGMPKPTGAVDLVLRGGNALLDKLVAMGLLPEDQAMGVRMMSSFFARPSGDDELSSRIEITEDGAVYANGQRLK